MQSILFLSLFIFFTSATFDLNTSGPDWDYTASDLALTTSQKCKDAYSASIDCDGTFLGLVASMRPGFEPSTSDFDRMCTSTCSDSLATYVKDVKAVCSAPGDQATESKRKSGGGYEAVPMDPVSVVGEIFQYVLVKSCAKDDNGNYCYFDRAGDDSTGKGYTSNPDFPCSDTCMIQFYTSAHQYNSSGGSSKMFNYYSLVSVGDWWTQNFQQGWNTVLQCQGEGNDTSSSSGSSVAGEATSTVTASAAASTAPTTVSAFSRPEATGTTSARSSSLSSFQSTPTSTAGAAAASGSRASSANQLQNIFRGLPFRRICKSRYSRRINQHIRN